VSIAQGHVKRLGRNKSVKNVRKEEEKRRMNKKILVSVMVIGLVAALAGAGLHAIFNDTETSTGNTFTAGTLNISLGTTSRSTGYNNMKPGDTVTFTIIVNSDGSLPLVYTITTSLSGDLAGGSNPCFVSAVRVDGTVKTAPYEDSLSASGGADPSDIVEIDITMPFEAGNEYQGKSGTLTVTFTASQVP
jgi:predicted ribosomally synthesized peptide with SipW-like signal peptide